jgi:hypothetical protein
MLAVNKRSRADGSLDLFVQRKSPGKERIELVSAPAKGSFTMNPRLYWPKAEVQDGSWQPAGVKRVQ